MADLQLWKKTNQLQLLISTWYRGSFGSKVQSPKSSFFGQNSLPKITPVRRRVLGKKLI